MHPFTIVQNSLIHSTGGASSDNNKFSFSFGDIDGDNLTDIILSKSGNTPANNKKPLYIRQLSSGGFGPPENITLGLPGYEDQQIRGVLDIDVDGDLDYLVLRASLGGSYKQTCWYETLDAPIDVQLGSLLQSTYRKFNGVKLSDLDQDGDMNILTHSDEHFLLLGTERSEISW